VAAWFEIFEDPAGKYRFHLNAASGEIIAASAGYETVASAEEAIEAIRTQAPGAAIEIRRQHGLESDGEVGDRASERMLLYEDVSDCPNGNEHRLRIWAMYDAADGLAVEGSDSTQWPCDDLTYTYHAAPHGIAQLRTALGGGDGDLVVLLAQHYQDGTLPALSLESWFKQHAVPYTGSEARHPN
jgi:uncharacterized protein YegP (UPF0339 family)